MNEAWQHLISSPLFGVTLTIGLYVGAQWLWRRGHRHPLLTPSFVAIVAIVVVLLACRIPYESYWKGGQYLNFLLGPATVALAIPLYRAGRAIRRMLVPVLAGVVAGAAAAMGTAVIGTRLLGGDAALAATLAPKSATTPISMVLSAGAGGNASLTACLTILTGVLGAVLAPPLLGLVRVRDPRVQGLAIGVSSHGIGTARALELGPLTGAFAALAMALSGVTTALLTPILLATLMSWLYGA